MTCPVHRDGSAIPLKDVAAAGGWNDVDTLLKVYQQPDRHTLLAVMSEPRKVSDCGAPLIVGSEAIAFKTIPTFADSLHAKSRCEGSMRLFVRRWRAGVALLLGLVTLIGYAGPTSHDRGQELPHRGAPSAVP